MFIKKIITLLLISILTSFNDSYSQDLTPEEIIKSRVEAGYDNEPVFANKRMLFSQVELSKFYSNRNYQLAWKDKKNRDDLIKSIYSSFDEGLDPEDYHLDVLNHLLKKSAYKRLNYFDLAELDLLLTDALILYASHLISGKVNQSKLRSEWDLEINKRPENVDSLLTVTLTNHKIMKAIENIKSQSYIYEHLKAGLKEYRKIVQNGGWEKVPEGATLKMGMEDERIGPIRDYLKITKDLLNSHGENENLFDKELEAAVKKFQYRHNLTEDGFIGKGTLQQMNISAEDRVEMIRLNLERARWVMNRPGDDFLLVNIAGFNMKRIINKKVVFESRVIVGKNHKESPIFKDEMEYMVMNPTWTLPYSISTHETLPKIKKDPSYLAKNHMEVMDRSGKILNPDQIDFNQYSSGNFPFIVRQKAGPHNALGQVKFIFPNKYSVYVHDTPSRSLFNRQDRAFSHGCIRLENKWGLLMSLMDEPNVWNMEKINSILDSGVTTTIKLKKHIDIYILYWTAGVDRDKNIFFERDVYNRDESVLKALNKPVDFKKVN